MAAMRCDAMRCDATPCDATSPSATPSPIPCHVITSCHAMFMPCGGRRHQTCAPFRSGSGTGAMRRPSPPLPTHVDASPAKPASLNSTQVNSCQHHGGGHVKSTPAQLSSTHALLAPDLSVASIMEAALAGPHERFILRWAWMNSLKSIEPEPSRSAIRKRPRSWRAL